MTPHNKLFRILAIVLLGCLVNKSVGEQPNVIIVITDDQGYGDLSCHGNPVLKTPNLDQLYLDSIRLTDYHVAPTCSPTRAALQTGLWTNRTGVWHTIMGRSMLRENQATIGDVFQKAGYRTGMFGKWHLGDNYPFRPEDRGYMEVLRHGGGGVGQTPDYWDNAYFDGHYFRSSYRDPENRSYETVAEKADGFCSDVFFEAAKTFIKEQKQAGKPFLAYISTNAPHGPMHSPVEFSKPYSEKGVGLANFLGMIANIDDNVGRLRKFLDKEGLSENTIFIFTTDNGTAMGHKVFNAGMRGNKGSEFEGGHRVPCFVHWPKGHLSGGKDLTTLTAQIDILPTLMDLCQIEDETDYRFDGQSIKELLLNSGTVDSKWARRMLVTDSQRVKDPIKWRKSAVMMDKWRLINGKQLFDLRKDPGQKNDIAAEHPDVASAMKNFYEAWWTELEPGFAQNANIRVGTKFESPSRLTSHDWITKGGTPWNQKHIRMALNSPNVLGHWNLHIETAGKYEIRIRRWPFETNKKINDPLPPGDDVPGVAAMRTQPGIAINVTKSQIRIAGQTYSNPVSADALESRFEVELESGETSLNSEFLTKDGKRYGGYFVMMKKL